MDESILLWAVGIIVAVLLWAVPIDKIKDQFKAYSIVAYIDSLNIRQEFKVAIVDDEISNYPLDYIKELGFSVKEYDSVSFADAQELVKNDLLLLDVKGVVKEDLEEGGAKLIKIIKEERPLIPVIAVSSGYFHTELNDYFKISDSTLNKPIDEYKIRELLFELKREFFDAVLIAKTIECCIRKLDIGKLNKNKLNKSVIDFVSRKISKTELLNIIHTYAKGESQEIINNSAILLDRVANA